MGIETGRVAFLIFSSDRGQLWQFYISIGDNEISIGGFIYSGTPPPFQLPETAATLHAKTSDRTLGKTSSG